MNNIKEQIRAEIERLYDGEAPAHAQQCDFDDGYFTGIAAISKFIDSLPDEQPSKGLDVTDFCKPIDPGIAQCIADHWWEMLGEDEQPDHIADASKKVSKDLEEAAITFATDTLPFGEDTYVDYGVYRGFLAGAQWQKEQFEKNRLSNCDTLTKEEYDKETAFAMEIIEKEHRQPTFTDAINYGMRLQREQMIKDAIDGECIDDANAGVEIDTKYGVLFLPPKTFKYEDKVKIIIVKEEQK